MVDVERWLSYKRTCHVILLAKLHDMYLYKTDNFFHINHYLKSVSKVALLHRFYCTLQRKDSSYLACIDRKAFVTSNDPKQYKLWSCQNVSDVLSYLLDNIFIPRHKIGAGYYGFTLDVRVSVCPSIRFSFPDDNLSKHQWIFTKLDMCIDIVKIWFG